MHIASHISQGKLTLKINQELVTDGGHAQVSFLGTGYEVIRTPDTLYLKGTPGFNSQLERRTGLHVPENTWIAAPTVNSKLAQYAALTNLESQPRRLLATTGALTLGATTTVDGQKAIEIKEHTKLSNATFYIAATGKPYPIQITKHGRETGQTIFTGWNQPITITPPANAVEVSTLEHGAH